MTNLTLKFEEDEISSTKIDGINEVLKILKLSISGISHELIIKNCKNDSWPGAMQEALSIFPQKECGIRYSNFRKLLKKGYEISLIDQFGIKENALRITKQNSHIVDLYSLPFRFNPKL